MGSTHRTSVAREAVALSSLTKRLAFDSALSILPLCADATLTRILVYKNSAAPEALLYAVYGNSMHYELRPELVQQGITIFQRMST